MFRIIRRSPWIAAGALGAWLLDGEQGPQRRAQVTSQAKRLVNSLTGATSARETFTNSPVHLPDAETPSPREMTADSQTRTSAKDLASEREKVGVGARG